MHGKICVYVCWGCVGVGISGATSETLLFGSHLSYLLSSVTIYHTGFIF